MSLSSLAFLRNLLLWSNLSKKEIYRQGIPEMPSVPLPSVRAAEMQEAMLSPPRDNLRDHPSLPPFSCLPGE